MTVNVNVESIASMAPHATPELHHQLPSVTEMQRELDKTVFGQRAAKRALCQAVYTHFLSLAERDLTGAQAIVPATPHVLLIGPSGSGKTLMVKDLARFLGAPFTLVGATSLVQTGYVGTSIDDMVRLHLARCGGDIPLAERGIIFLDEVDKVRSQRSTGIDVSGEGVQNALLATLDGVRVPAHRNESHPLVDTSTILFISAGAFVGLDDIRAARRGRSASPTGGLPPPVQPSDLLQFGLIPQFLARFPHIAELSPLSVDDLGTILTKPGSVLERKKHYFRLHGITLHFQPEALAAVAQIAAQRGTGARALAVVLEETLALLPLCLVELAKRGVNLVTVTADTVRKARPPEYIFGPRPPNLDTLPATALRQQYGRRSP